MHIVIAPRKKKKTVRSPNNAWIEIEAKCNGECNKCHGTFGRTQKIGFNTVSRATRHLECVPKGSVTKG